MKSAARDPSLEHIQRELDRCHGQAYWQRLEELSTTEPVRKLLEEHFPSQQLRLDHTLDRRGFLQVMGASLALAGLGGCTRQPKETIVPYGRNPEDVIPGKPLYFATAYPSRGDALGILVESHMGRPTKVEGNPEHPSSLGATDSQAQASILDLYDPDRSHAVLNAGRIDTWDRMLTRLVERVEGHQGNGGKGLRVLSESILSPTLSRQRDLFLELFPEAGWHQWQADHRDQVRAGSLLAFGEDLTPRYRLDQADVILVLDGDVLHSDAGSLRHAREFAARREPDAEGGMNRLYVAESSPTLTGGMADHRLVMSPAQIEDFAREVAAGLGVSVTSAGLPEKDKARAQAVAADLKKSGARAVVMPGFEQSPAVHALAAAMNQTLGSVGGPVSYAIPSQYAPTSCSDSLRELAADMDAGDVETLVILGGNPVYTAPGDVDFESALEKVPFTVHLSAQEDETSFRCVWHVPELHPLESWSDLRAHDGTCSIVQPLIAPLFGGRSAHELVAALCGKSGQPAHDLVRDHWKRERGMTEDSAAFESFWKTSLHDGVIAGTAFESRSVPAVDVAKVPRSDSSNGDWSLCVRMDSSVRDGRYANNGWLQESPRSLTRLTWGNAACLSPADARELNVEAGDLVELRLGEQSTVAPAWPMPGHPDRTVTVHLGAGREQIGKVGRQVGFDANPLRSSAKPWNRSGLTVRALPGRKHALASVQDHANMEGRDLVRRFDLADWVENGVPEDAGGSHHGDLSMYPGHPPAENAWGMVINLNTCTGCDACLVSCQAENNIPVVGRDEVLNGREMHWIRIDRYYEGEDENPEVLHQPVPCMHCEEAPCEVVCPVAATVHSPEGLNEMVYNRCVGTRYCSNNCPYKVRRFNFFGYSDTKTEVLKLGRNPDVTVRTRGVMEKCTYCVQRINQARIEAKKEGRPIRDGEVRTACQAVCPTQAITFGNLNDASSEVARLRENPRHYALLEELGTKPRTTYLAKLKNPNPEYPA